MALKRLLADAEFKKLSPEFQKEYIQKGDSYELDIEGAEDTGALKRAKDHEAKARKDAENKLKELEAQLDAATKEREEMLTGAIPKADVEKLRSSYEGKLKNRETELSAKISKLQTQVSSSLVDNVAIALASEVSTAPALITPIIRARLAMEETSEGFQTRILDREGKPSAFTIDDLKKEILANKEFSPILKASNATGGGASGARGSGGAGSSGKIDFSKSAKEIAAQMKASGKVQA
jgi:hypothetical protein